MQLRIRAGLARLGPSVVVAVLFGCGHTGAPAPAPSSARGEPSKTAEPPELKVWDEFRRLVDERDGPGAAERVAEVDLALFAFYRSLALYASKERLEVVRPWLAVPALALRALTKPSELEAMTPREVCALLVSRTLQSEGWPRHVTLEKRQGATIFARLSPNLAPVPILRLEGSKPDVALTELLSNDRWAMSERLGSDVKHPEPVAPQRMLEEAARWVGMPASEAWWNELIPGEAPKTASKQGKNGRLAAEVIQRTVRESFTPLRFCYEDGLHRNPALEGRIDVRFVIEASGRIGEITHTSTMADDDVNDCLVGTFGVLVFPKPVGGIVTVTYPIKFSPG